MSSRSTNESDIDFQTGLKVERLFSGGSEMADRMRGFDWGKTSLGPVQRWPHSLRTAVRIMLTSAQPVWIGWGRDLACLYNDSCRSIIGSKDAWALGRPAAEVWSKCWNHIGPMLSKAIQGEEGTSVNEQLLIKDRRSHLEESYYTFFCSPIPVDEGGAGGVICTGTEDTQRVISGRQLSLLRELATRTAEAHSWRQACEDAALALATDPHDLPFVVIYVAEPNSLTLALAGRCGIAAGHEAAPAAASMDDDGVWPLAEAMRRQQMSVVTDLQARYKGGLPTGAWAQPPAAAAVVPFPAAGDIGPAGVLVVGLNPFRQFDEDYQGFLKLAAGQIATAIANAQACASERTRAVDRLDHAKRTFFSNVSHEFRTPLRERAEDIFQLLVEGVSDYALYMLDPGGHVSSWNTGAERIKGYAASEVIGQHYRRFYTEEDRAGGLPERALKEAGAAGKWEMEGWRVRKDGSRFWASVVINRITDRAGTLLGFAKVTRDVTERREAQQALVRTQEQLAQAQKMEGIGQLTGGVAHDFNNLLTIILGNLETIQRTLQQPSPDVGRITRSAENAARGAQRAAALTQRLLAFSRRQPLDPKPVDISRLVSSMSDLLRRTLGEQIAIEAVLAGGLWRAHVDPNQLEVAILNLAVNARDAMPNGGRLTIETANTHLDEVYAAAQAEVAPGQYVAICVTDTGAGMTSDVLARAFEPFFTTKEIGQGTGLGLSQVYGFVKQSGGHVKIYSEPGQGTTVKLYVPRRHGDFELDPGTDAGSRPPLSDGSETILVVEDEEDVRRYSTEILRELGYVVLDASTGSAALRMLDAHPEIVLLFTDVGLPGSMNGQQLAKEARKRRPDLKVLFTTGYARNAIVHGGRLDPGVLLITKPFTYAALATKLRDILDARAGPARVLLVEDEPLVRILATEYLEEAGLRVEAAVSATDAINKLRLIPGGVDAAIVDVGLPDRNGDVLVAELRAIYPDLAIVVASGYQETHLKERFKQDERIAFLRKPYSREELLKVLLPLR